MTSKADFTDEEWTLLREAPASAGMLVVQADKGGMFRETFSMGKAYTEARKQHGGLSIGKFMSGYGARVNDPESLWDRSVLAGRSNRLTILLMSITLLAVLTLFLAALTLDVHTRSGS